MTLSHVRSGFMVKNANETSYNNRRNLESIFLIQKSFQFHFEVISKLRLER